MIQLISKDKCSGCSACFNACKTEALSMIIDNTGFWYPQINKIKCIECGACVDVCPAINKTQYQSKMPRAYIAQNTDDEIRRQSTSGGAFSAIAQKIIQNNGIVFGATLESKGLVSHTWVDKVSGLAKFRNSKYVQSKTGYSYREAEEFLKNGKLVCFSGTPCQIYGLKKYLKKEYENLLTVDVMCRAVPSPKVLNKYLDYQKEKYPEFDCIVFRDKGRGYSYSGIALYKSGKVVYRGGSEADPWLRLFLGGYCNREACYNCFYQNGVRASDITLWDCWGTQNYEPKWDDNKGTTNVIVWTKKGQDWLKQTGDCLRAKEIGINNIDASLNRSELNRPRYNREVFFKDCDTLSAKQFINKYVPITAKIRIKASARVIMHKLHLHNAIRKVVHKLRKAKRG